MFSCACGVLFSTLHHNSAIIQAAYMYDMQAIIYAVVYRKVGFVNHYYI